jgi:hypothetical protein
MPCFYALFDSLAANVSRKVPTGPVLSRESLRGTATAAITIQIVKATKGTTISDVEGSRLLMDCIERFHEKLEARAESVDKLPLGTVCKRSMPVFVWLVEDVL